jgi:hypothetical protein
VRRQRAAFTRLNKARMTAFEVRHWQSPGTKAENPQNLHLRLSALTPNMHWDS